MPPFPTPEDQFGPYRFHHYESINTLNDDVLLVIFNHYRLDNEINWNIRMGWCNLSQVCRRWRYLVYGSAFYLGLQILCTNGTPLVDTLIHLPPLPMLVDYQYSTATLIDAQDELGIFLAFHLRDRLHRVVLRIPPSILDQLMDDPEPFPVLSHLSLSSSAEKGTILLLSKTLLAPNLRHLTLLGIGLPKKMVFLSSTVSLVTLTLANIRDFGYFLPQHLIARLRSFSQLEELSIGFSVPLPRPSSDGELSQDMEAPVMLPLLKRLTFRGVNVYFDSFVARITAPLLEQLSITLFNRIYFALPHLSHFINATEGLRLPIAKIIFKPDAVSIVTDQREQQPGDGPSSFSLHLMCKQFDWQIDSAAQICSALVTTMFGIEELSLEFEGQRVSAEWQDNAVDAATWRELLGPFTGARKLCIGRALSWELSCAMEWAEIGSDPGLLPNLEELAAELEEHAGNAFMSFIGARQATGRPVLLSVPSLGSRFRAFFQAALKSYRNQTKQDPLAHPIASQLQSCESTTAVLAILQDQVRFEKKTEGDERLTKWLDPTVNVLSAFSATFSGGVSMVFSPASVIFAAVGVFLQAAQDVAASKDVLAELFERIGYLFARLETYTNVPPTTAMTDMIAQILVEVLKIFGIATKELKLESAKKFLRELGGMADLNDALKKLDTLTQEVARMAIAEVLRLARSIRDGVKIIDGKVEEVGDRVQVMIDDA